ncbi:MAG: hypothetical protein AB1641_17200 [Thermodesulfobacteriota bacterium]
MIEPPAQKPFRLMMWFSHRLGGWVVRMVAWFISTGYFLFRRPRVAAGLEFYRALFPTRSMAYHYYCVWKQFHDFAAGYADRLALESGGEPDFRSEGWHLLEEAAGAGRGGVILMSHFGPWEIGARLFSRSGLKLMLLMGEQGRQVEQVQKADLKQDGLKVEVSPSEAAAPLMGLEAMNFLKSGGFVSAPADLSWTESRWRVPVRFLGHEVFLPGGPHLLALLAGSPLFIFLAFRLGRHKHRFVLKGPYEIKAASRNERWNAVVRSAQIYAGELETAARSRPWQWHVFQPFLGRKLTGADGSKPGGDQQGEAG